MIQRQQSLWLLLSALCALFSYYFSFYVGTTIDIHNIPVPDELYAARTFPLLLLTGASLILALITIFLYKDRKLQFRLAIGGAILSLLIIVIYFMGTRKFIKPSSLSLSSLLVFGMLAGYIMAARGIRKDEKLVKSLDKLR
jgi:hypothetical protein